MQPRHGDAGFTLLEALVALALVAMGITILAEGLSAAIVGGSRADRRARAALVADEVLARVREGELAAAGPVEGELAALDAYAVDDVPTWGEGQTSGGSATPAEPTIAWRYKIELEATDVEGLEKVTVTAMDPVSGESVSIETLRNHWPEDGR